MEDRAEGLRVLTVPNLISLLRLACVPVFLWLLLGIDRPVTAGVLLAVLGATDWVDGWIARHFDQGSEVGKVLDPVADRVLLLAAGVALTIDGSVPLVVGVLVLAREVAISVATVGLALAGARRIDVEWVGKLGTLSLMFAFPAFLLADEASAGHDALLAAAWAFTVVGLAGSYYATWKYVPQARLALREGRSHRVEVAA